MIFAQVTNIVFPLNLSTLSPRSQNIFAKVEGLRIGARLSWRSQLSVKGDVYSCEAIQLFTENWFHSYPADGKNHST